MKKFFFSVLALAIFLGSCGNNSNDQTDSHTHDDGSVHNNHVNDSEVAPEQEVFEVQKDSVQLENDSLKSVDESEHSHSHDDGKEHKH